VTALREVDGVPVPLSVGVRKLYLLVCNACRDTHSGIFPQQSIW